MEWLSQNWVWIVVAVGVVWLFARMRAGGAMGGCCGGHDMAHEGPHEARKAQGTDTPGSAAKETGEKAAQGAASSQRQRGGCC